MCLSLSQVPRACDSDSLQTPKPPTKNTRGESWHDAVQEIEAAEVAVENLGAHDENVGLLEAKGTAAVMGTTCGELSLLSLLDDPALSKKDKTEKLNQMLKKLSTQSKEFRHPVKAKVMKCILDAAHGLLMH